MLRTLIKRLFGVPPNPEPTGLIVAPANIPVPETEIHPPYRVPLMRTRYILRRNINDTLVLAGTTVRSRKSNVNMKVASGEQHPPYVRCLYRGRTLAVRADTIDCRWDTVSEPIQ